MNHGVIIPTETLGSYSQALQSKLSQNKYNRTFMKYWSNILHIQNLQKYTMFPIIHTFFLSSIHKKISGTYINRGLWT